MRDEATTKRYYDIMLRETLRLSRLINDLMELSRLQSGQHPDRAADAPDEILDDLAEKYTAAAQERGLAFRCRRERTDAGQRQPRPGGAGCW